MRLVLLTLTFVLLVHLLGAVWATVEAGENETMLDAIVRERGVAPSFRLAYRCEQST